MSERSEPGAEPTNGGRVPPPAPGASREPDWYLADTYARDPFAGAPYAPADGPGPYDLTTDEPDGETGPAPAPTSAADPDAAAGRQLPAQQNGGTGQDSEPPAPVLEEPVVPASRWARAATAAAARSNATQGPGLPSAAPTPAAERVEPAGSLGDTSSPGDTGTTEYVGVDALLSRTAPATAATTVTAAATATTAATTATAEAGRADEPREDPEPAEPFVPVIEFDPPLTPEEIGLREPAAAEPALAGAPAGPPGPPPLLDGPEDPDGPGGPDAPEPTTEPAPASTPDGAPAAATDPVSDAAAPVPDRTPGPPAAPASTPAGKVTGLLSSSAIMAAGTLVSRATGFLRTVVIAAAIGVGTMGDSYSAANTLPTLLYILIGGGALNAVFVPQLVRSMKQDPDGGTAYANRLLTLVMTGLAGVVFVAVLAAPLLVQLISHSLMADQGSADTTVALARYCLPTIFFMGVHVVMGQILNARGRFGAMMWTPVLNNIVVIFSFTMYLWVFGTFEHSRVTPQSVSPEGLRLLGIGTLLGLAVQALAMIPYLRETGFRFRPRFDWRGHGLGKAARLAKWTFLFVLANQAGYLVVTQLATAAGQAAEAQGFLGVGLAAYSNALLIWQLPMAVITVSVMSAVLPRLSRSAADEDAGAVRDDLSYGLRTSAVAIVPAAFLFLALGPEIGGAIYGLGNGGSAAHGSTAVGYMLSAFALGLIPYSVQYVLLRGFYAYEDTRTPFSNTVWVAGAQAGAALLCYLVLPAQWAVTGMALGYGASYALGVAVAVPKLKQRIGGLDTGRIVRTYTRLAIASVPGALVGFLLSLPLHELLGSLLGDWAASLVTVALAGATQLAVFVTLARRMRIEELNAVTGMVRGRLGR